MPKLGNPRWCTRAAGTDAGDRSVRTRNDCVDCARAVGAIGMYRASARQTETPTYGRTLMSRLHRNTGTTHTAVGRGDRSRCSRLPTSLATRTGATVSQCIMCTFVCTGVGPRIIACAPAGEQSRRALVWGLLTQRESYGGSRIAL